MSLLSKLIGLDPISALMYAAYGILIARLAWTGLFRKYPNLFAYICFQVLRPVVLSFFPLRSIAYGNIFFASQPILWILMFLVLLELFQQALDDKPGIASFSRKFVMGAMGIAAAISVCTLFFNLQDSTPRYIILESFLLVDRVVHLALLLFLLLLIAFLGYFPVLLHRNARVHVAVLSFYFLAKTVVLLFRTIAGVEVAYQANFAGRLIMIGCLATWCVLLSKAGEKRKVHSSWISNPDDQERLIAQLDMINATLIRTAKGANG